MKEMSGLGVEKNHWMLVEKRLPHPPLKKNKILDFLFSFQLEQRHEGVFF